MHYNYVLVTIWHISEMNIQFTFDFLNHLKLKKNTDTATYHQTPLSKVQSLMKTAGGMMSEIDTKLLTEFLCQSRSDLRIICEDEKTIMSHKLLLGIVSRYLGDIFLQDDFISESVTTILIPVGSDHMRGLLNNVHVMEKAEKDLLNMLCIPTEEKTSGSANTSDYCSVNLDDDDIVDVSSNYPADVKEELKAESASLEHGIKEDRDDIVQINFSKKIHKKVKKVTSGTFKRNRSKAEDVPDSCHVCGWVGKSPKHLIYHLKGHDGGWNGISRCKKCLRHFPNEEIEEHRKECDQIPIQKLFRCHGECGNSSCNRRFKSPSHLLYHHNFVSKDNRDKYKCNGECGVDSCSQVFFARLRYLSHIAISKKKAGSKIEFTELQCNGDCGDASCTKFFDDLALLQRHKKKQHRSSKTCHLCGFESKNSSSFLQHMTRHEGGWKGKSQCTKCPKIFATELLNEHLMTCDPKVVCNICGQGYRDKNCLAEHIKRVHEAKEFQYVCEICSKGFAFKGNLSSHMRRVHIEKSACPECGKMVRSLKMHRMNAHTPDALKNFQCQDCGKGFMVKKELEEHRMSVHIKLRPYNCRYGCDIAYNDTSNRNQHEKKKHGKLFTSPKDEEENLQHH